MIYKYYWIEDIGILYNLHRCLLEGRMFEYYDKDMGKWYPSSNGYSEFYLAMLRKKDFTSSSCIDISEIPTEKAESYIMLQELEK